MLRMAQIQYIKDLFENEDLSLRKISRRTNHSFNTVKKYAYQENWGEGELPNLEPESYPVLGDFIPIIDEWLEADRKVPRKQRHTMWRMFCRLRDEHGFTGSYSSVKRYVRKKKFTLSWKEEKRMCQLETELKDVLVEMAAVKGAEEALKRMEDI